MGKKKNGNEFLVQGGILAAAGMISRIIGKMCIRDRQGSL